MVRTGFVGGEGGCGRGEGVEKRLTAGEVLAVPCCSADAGIKEVLDPLEEVTPVLRTVYGRFDMDSIQLAKEGFLLATNIEDFANTDSEAGNVAEGGGEPVGVGNGRGEKRGVKEQLGSVRDNPAAVRSAVSVISSSVLSGEGRG